VVNSGLIVLAAAVLAAEPAKSEPIPAGSGSFVFRDEAGNRERPITVWTWRPDDFRPDAPILLVMHGTTRQGRAYRDSWIRHARAQGALLAVPEFPELHYPGGGWYQLGNLHGTPELGSPEVLDWDRLRRALAAASAPGASGPAARVAARVPEKLREGFAAALRAEPPDDAAKLAILKALNELLDDKELYRPEDFPEAPPALRTARHPRALSPGMLRPVNRELLGVALPLGLAAPDYAARPRDKWTYAAVERIFDQVCARSGSTRTGYLLYGHSAGAQFVQRMVMLLPECRAERAAAANAGKYLWPSTLTQYPYGLGGLKDFGDRELARALARPLLVMAGEEDVAEDAEKDPDLPVSDDARHQGRNRLERARFFHRAAERAATGMGRPFAWELCTVKDVAHSNTGMAGQAAEWLFKSAAEARERRQAPPGN